MQNMITEQAQARRKEHAKLLTVGDRQVLAFMQRDADDALAIILQLWIARSDEQLQVKISFPADDGFATTDRVVEEVFDELTNASIERTLKELGVAELLTIVDAD